MMDLTKIKTPGGKTVSDFQIPESFLSQHPDIVALVLQSESMDDGERQYWFDLYPSMDADHIERLRGILEKERKRRAEIQKKYEDQKPKEKLTPEQIAERNKAFAEKKRAQKEALSEKEDAFEVADTEREEALLRELEGL